MLEPKTKVYVLPILRLTTVGEISGNGSLPVDHQINGVKVKYWRDTKFEAAHSRKTFAKFPIVLNADGSPWDPAVLWLMDKAKTNPGKLSSLLPIAQALRDYKVFLDDFGFDWSDFSSIEKLLRPTYVYLTHLRQLVSTGQIKPSTANRRMSTVIGLYRFAQCDQRLRFKPANEPWVDKKITIRYQDVRGFNRHKDVATTDLRIRIPPEEDALSDTINDGGKLRPMTVEEQKALVSALQTLDNTEFSLMHYLGLLTGAREMTVMTLRLKDFVSPPSTISSWPYKVRCGPGTGIDTKLDRTNVYLNIPEALYGMLHVYGLSERAKKRRAKSRMGDSPLNYLFLTRQGNPYYEGKDDRDTVRETNGHLRRTSAQGQSLRGFIANHVIPEVRKILPEFRYKFHDTRATFAMNWIDHVMGTENSDSKKYYWALDQLRKMMWHKNIATTEKYLEYRSHRHHLDSAMQGWASHLLTMIEPVPQREDHPNDLEVYG
ncbi:site-specific integrase [Janthinobacterium lividum]|uniref:site-specific integrase n=1 Tax=Janthinobacterium lividum TaxID=29581 RepID=UPI000690C11C|nr:site-specific integrase [Janthinobacterium lividum]